MTDKTQDISAGQTALEHADGASWSASFFQSDAELLSFSVGGAKLFSASGIRNHGGNIENCRSLDSLKHHRNDGFPGGSIESVSHASAPFFTSRSFEYAGNRFKVTLDAAFPKDYSSECLLSDEFCINPDVAETSVISAPADLSPYFKRESYSRFVPGTPIESELAPISWIFKFRNGAVLEIGTGDDIWRWNIAEALGASSKFSVSNEDKEIRLLRRPLFSELPIPTQRRKFRFTWFFAWDFPKQRKLVDPGEESLVLDLAKDFNWPESARIMKSDGNTLPVPCFHSDIVWNVLRKTIRKNLDSKYKRIVFKNPPVSCACFSAAHLDRAKKKFLVHGNTVALMNFWLWANRRLNPIGSEFHFLTAPEDDAAASRPSIKGLSIINQN